MGLYFTTSPDAYALAAAARSWTGFAGKAFSTIFEAYGASDLIGAAGAATAFIRNHDAKPLGIAFPGFTALRHCSAIADITKK
jgi:hypothetical protein